MGFIDSVLLKAENDWLDVAEASELLLRYPAYQFNLSTTQASFSAGVKPGILYLYDRAVVPLWFDDGMVWTSVDDIFLHAMYAEHPVILRRVHHKSEGLFVAICFPA